MSDRWIVASSGGFVGTGLWGVMRPGRVFHRALELSSKERPRVLFILTASGDDPQYLAAMYSALADTKCDVDHLSLFPQPNRPAAEAIERADVVWVGGGSVANLLALWRLHGVDTALRDAWESGTVLGGVSAGSICWHVGGPTDSFGKELQPVTDSLAFLPYGNGVHYDSEEQRRPLLHELVRTGVLPVSYATDDRVAIVYQGIEPVEVVTDLPDSSSAAYRVSFDGNDVVEERLAPGPISHVHD
jgi:peptidase E